ncbi:hypothetical protein [Kutzneria kofuensis]
MSEISTAVYEATAGPSRPAPIVAARPMPGNSPVTAVAAATPAAGP